LGEIEPKLALTFTCTVEGCGERSSHQFTKRSYEKGIVLVQCPGCKNRHLIADHLGWFAQDASEPKTIEEMVAQKGGRVQRGVNWVDDKGYDTVEIFD
ncbi:zf-DNL-domain-containing protein, partial [Acaromyces ingoldii]